MTDKSTCAVCGSDVVGEWSHGPHFGCHAPVYDDGPFAANTAEAQHDLCNACWNKLAGADLLAAWIVKEQRALEHVTVDLR